MWMHKENDACLPYGRNEEDTKKGPVLRTGPLATLSQFTRYNLYITSCQ